MAGDWSGAFDAQLRDKVRKTAPNEPLLVALDILAVLDQPGGKEKQLQDAAARLSALRPWNQEALSLSAAAYVAAGKPEPAVIFEPLGPSDRVVERTHRLSNCDPGD